MAQRFGRNQRRRARAQIADLQQAVQNQQRALEMKNALLARVSTEKSALNETMREARYILGDSVALPAQESRDRPAAGATSYNVDPVRPMDFSEFLSATAHESLKLQIECMQLLVTRVEENQYRGGVHCRVQLAEGHWAYAISEQALSRLTPGMLELRLLPELSRQFAQAIAQHMDKRRR